MKTKSIVIIILIILLLCVIWIFLQGTQGERIAQIYKNGTLVYSCSLNEITESLEYRIDKHNIAKISKSGAKMVYADCPDKVCIETGLITGGAYPIVCLPNKVEIRISGGGADAVSQ